VSFKSDKNNWCFTLILYIWRYFSEFFLEREIFRTKAVEKIKTHVIFSNLFFETLPAYEIMCKNMIEQAGPQMTIYCGTLQYTAAHYNILRHISITYRITETKIQTHAHYNKYLLLQNRLFASDLVKCFTATLSGRLVSPVFTGHEGP
jgi:hypothetical protein